MKKLLLVACFTLFLFTFQKAQVPTAMPSAAIAFFNKAVPIIRPELKDFITRKSIILKNHRANGDSLQEKFRKERLLKTMGNNDITGLVVLVMVQGSINADDELKQMVMAISRGGNYNGNGSATAKSVSLKSKENKSLSAEDLQQMENLKLQAIMDRKSEIAKEVNYLMQKISGAQPAIIADLK